MVGPSSTRVASRFQEELREAINRNSKENGSDTPDFVLASYLSGCLDVFDSTLQKREGWYGRGKPVLGQTKTAGAADTGVYIPLPKELADQFPKKKEDRSPPHITVLFIGKVPKGKEKVLAETVQRHFGAIGPVRAVLGPLDRFLTQDQKVVFSRIRLSRDLAPARKALWDDLVSQGFEVVDSFPTWSPHTTLAYMSPNEEWEGVPPTGSWLFSSVEIWGPGQKKPVSLGGEEPPLASAPEVEPEVGERRMARILEKRANAAELETRWASTRRKIPLMVLRGWAAALNRSVTCPLGDVTPQEVQEGLNELLDFHGDNPDYWDTFIAPGGRLRQLLDSDDFSFICRHIQYKRR